MSVKKNKACISATYRPSSDPGETRTPNLLIRSQMLYPLSYGANFIGNIYKWLIKTDDSSLTNPCD